MLDSYFQNTAVSMTKDQYFEMCELLGSEPIDSEVPIEYNDLPLDVQEAFSVYKMLPDSWEYMYGSYTGKNYAGLGDILRILKVEDELTVLNLLELLDRKRKKAIEMMKESAPVNTTETSPA